MFYNSCAHHESNDAYHSCQSEFQVVVYLYIHVRLCSLSGLDQAKVGSHRLMWCRTWKSSEEHCPRMYITRARILSSGSGLPTQFSLAWARLIPGLEGVAPYSLPIIWGFKIHGLQWDYLDKSLRLLIVQFIHDLMRYVC